MSGAPPGMRVTMANAPPGMKGKRQRNGNDTTNGSSDGSSSGTPVVTDGHKRHRTAALTVRDIFADTLTPLANQYWAPGQELSPYSAEVIEHVYHKELVDNPNIHQRIMVLELSSYLENYLWRYFDPKTATFAHVMSLVLLINEKFRENMLSIWEPFREADRIANFRPLFMCILSLPRQRELSIAEKTSVLFFWIHCTQSLEDDIVRDVIYRLTSKELWNRLSAARLKEQLREHTIEQRMIASRRTATHDDTISETEANWMTDMHRDFFGILDTLTTSSLGTGVGTTTGMNMSDIRARINYCERFLEWTIDLLTQAQTRCFFLAYIIDTHFVERCLLSPLYIMRQPVVLSATNGTMKEVGELDEDAESDGDLDENEDGVEKKKNNKSVNDAPRTVPGPGKLFAQLLDMVKYYQGFEINGKTGEAISDQDMVTAHATKMISLSKVAFKYLGEEGGRALGLANSSVLDTRVGLHSHLNRMQTPSLRRLARLLGLIGNSSSGASNGHSHGEETRELVLEILLTHFELRRSQTKEVQAMSIFPADNILWDMDLVPSMHYSGETALALPKLNLQFLTLHDYLQRNFNLFRLESTYEIREDIASTVAKLRPRLNSAGTDTVFTGWARMALPIYSFTMTQVKKPDIGETKPSLVRGEITVDLSPFSGKVRDEWEQLRDHDVLFLITVRAVKPLSSRDDADTLAAPSDADINRHTLGIQYVRGCELKHVVDERKNIIGERDKDGKVNQPWGNLRTYRVDFDAAQYEMDQSEVLDNKSEDMYATFNLVMRRKPKENNFKAVLSTIRDLMATKCRVPSWLHDVFLGAASSKAAATYWAVGDRALKDISFNDTFLDLQHVKDSFLEPIQVSGRLSTPEEIAMLGHAPFTISFPPPATTGPDYAALHTQLARASVPGELPSNSNTSNSENSGTAATETPSFSLTITPPSGISGISIPSSSPSLLSIPSSPQAPLSPLPTFTRAAPAAVPDFTLTAPAAPAKQAATKTTTSDSKISGTEVKKPEFTDEDIEKMLVKDLTAALDARKIDTKKARKSDLQTKLREALAKEQRAYNEAKLVADNAAAASASAPSDEDDTKYEAAHRAFEQEHQAFEAKRREYEAEKQKYTDALAEWEKARDAHQEEVQRKIAKREADRQRRKADAAARAQAATATATATAAAVVSGEEKRAPIASLTSLPPPAAASAASSSGDAPLLVRSDRRPLPWGYYPKRNRVRFTPIQVEAIKSGVNPGLTMIVGPPGTGKTDVAVQIMSELYHNFPGQRTLVVTHSNHALNDLFEKIMQRDIPERYLLRLGHGAEGLESDRDFSKFGRVQDMLYRRTSLLEQVRQLALSMNMSDDVAYTCETAAHFWKYHIEKGWEKFTIGVERADADWKKGIRRPKPTPKVVAPVVTAPAPVRSKKSGRKSKPVAGDGIEEFDEDEDDKAMDETNDTPTPVVVAAAPPTPAVPVVEETGEAADARDRARVIAETFPFKAYFEREGHMIFGGTDIIADMNAARDLYRHLTNMFVELEECRPFELLRTYNDRGNYLVTKHAKVIAMTCTHAAIRRGELVKNAFQYDNLIMEEAAQILEIETFIPMLLQNDDAEFGSRLKRVILLGDHHQLPPVVKNRAFQRYSHMDQSLFTRFIRLGVPHIQLNGQGRCRADMALLWNWRYQNLMNLPSVTHEPRFATANAGLAHVYQFINVDDYLGSGESCPNPHFYQNLGEAEYIVQMYMYMRLMGYPADKISIITTYNGQKALIKDVIAQRCATNPLFGSPARVSTVDKFQGQQNDYILLSLVRTKTAGHVRDVRRLIVAMSRARLGLYVFGRQSLYANCYELIRTFNELLKRPTQLQLVPGEKSIDGTTSRLVNSTVQPFTVVDVTHMGKIVAEETLRTQREIGEYQRRVKQFEDDQRAKAEARERRERELRAAKETMARDEAQLAVAAARETEFARQTARMDRELTVQPEGSSRALAEAAAPINSDDEDDEDDAPAAAKSKSRTRRSGLGLESDAVSE